MVVLALAVFIPSVMADVEPIIMIIYYGGSLFILFVLYLLIFCLLGAFAPKWAKWWESLNPAWAESASPKTKRSSHAQSDVEVMPVLNIRV